MKSKKNNDLDISGLVFSDINGDNIGKLIINNDNGYWEYKNIGPKVSKLVENICKLCEGEKDEK